MEGVRVAVIRSPLASDLAGMVQSVLACVEIVVVARIGNADAISYQEVVAFAILRVPVANRVPSITCTSFSLGVYFCESRDDTPFCQF